MRDLPRAIVPGIGHSPAPRGALYMRMRQADPARHFTNTKLPLSASLLCPFSRAAYVMLGAPSLALGSQSAHGRTSALQSPPRGSWLRGALTSGAQCKINRSGPRAAPPMCVPSPPLSPPLPTCPPHGDGDGMPGASARAVSDGPAILIRTVRPMPSIDHLSYVGYFGRRSGIYFRAARPFSALAIMSRKSSLRLDPPTRNPSMSG